MSLGLFVIDFTLVHFTFIFNEKGEISNYRHLVLCIHPYSCIMVWWWPEFRVDTIVALNKIVRKVGVGCWWMLWF